MNVDDFRRMYVIELQELRSVEDQLVQALPKMVQLVEHPGLRSALELHLAETRSQRDRLDELLKKHSAGTREHQDGSMATILREAERWAGMVSDPDSRDAGIIASAQRVEHYEIAVYGTLATWARQLGLEDDARTLHRILEQERRADETLTRLAETAVNRDASAHGSAHSSSGIFEETTDYVRATTRPVSHQVEDYPIAAMLLAGVAGYVLAYFAHAPARESSHGV